MWILAWHYLQPALALLIMLILLQQLTTIFIRLQLFKPAIVGLNYYILHVPLIIYFSWICVATIANTTALLVSLNWNGFGLEATYWSTGLLVVALLFAFYFGYRQTEPTYALVSAWAFYGIYKAQFTTSELVGTTALISCFIALILAAFGWWRSRQVAPINGLL
jgi:hypothetical protein